MMFNFNFRILLLMHYNLKNLLMKYNFNKKINLDF